MWRDDDDDDDDEDDVEDDDTVLGIVGVPSMVRPT